MNLSDIEKIDTDTINPLILMEKGLVKYALRPRKILGGGEFSSKINITASAFSSSAINKIEKAGGTATAQ